MPAAIEEAPAERFLDSQSFQAMLNVLEDFDAETTGSQQTNRAVLNILEDLRHEKALTASLNTELERRVLERTAELAQSEERFRLLIDGVKDHAIFMLDLEGRVVTWNKGAAHLKGYATEEVLGRNYSCFYAPAAIAAGKPAQELQRALQHGSFEDEAIRVRKDGSTFMAGIVITAVFDEAGRHVGFAQITHDITERKAAERRFRTAVEAAPTGMLMIGNEGEILMFNAHAERLFGYARDEILGESVEVLLPESFRGNHLHLRPGYFAKPETRGMGVGRDLFGLRKDGSTFPMEIQLNPIETEEGFFVLATIADISERRAAQVERLEAARREQLLTKEVHHRVKNNLQVVSSLLFLQSSSLTDPSMREIFRESQSRIKSIALIHEKLYGSTDLSRIDFGGYVRDLIADLCSTYDVSHADVSVNTEIEGVLLQIDTAIPCGLILNELVSNVFKHAFPRGRKGRLDVGLMVTGGGEFLLTVRDDGAGMPNGFDVRTSTSFGVGLVRDLTQQLDGTIEWDTGHGTAVNIKFREIKNGKRNPT